MRNHEVTKVQPLLNARTALSESRAGQGSSVRYTTGTPQGSEFRIKEWDYYLIIS